MSVEMTVPTTEQPKRQRSRLVKGENSKGVGRHHVARAMSKLIYGIKRHADWPDVALNAPLLLYDVMLVLDVPADDIAWALGDKAVEFVDESMSLGWKLNTGHKP